VSPVRLLVRAIEAVGRLVLAPVEEVGRASWILGFGLVDLFRRPLRVGLTVDQIEFIGIQSLPIILLSAAFTGAVFTYESFEAFAYFGAQGLVGGTVGVAITRELAPTLTGLLVAGRAGSAMAAELGSMRVTEQIDALDAMAVDPVNYLVKPRLVASVVSVPLLTAVFDGMGILGSYLVGVHVLHLSPPEYLVRLKDWVDWEDIWAGLVKAIAFGLIIGVVACYKGYYAEGGAAGVGRATTSSVVVASVTILVTNYFIALLLPPPI
jgi:phospholipid/cholesterol/gamma-HCH transport system permease protein